MKLAPAGSVDVLRLGVVPSGSLAETAKFKLRPSVTLCAPIVARIGVWLPASLTVIETISESAASAASVA